MDDQLHIDAEALADEAVRYLVIVDAFRALGSEPSWRHETTPVDRHSELERPVRVERSTH